MALKVDRVDTWAASMEDKPGNLAGKLNALAGAGINLEFIISRRTPDRPGGGVVFVTPIKGSSAARLARQAGFEKTKDLHTLRIEGPDKVGQVAKLAQALADKGINLRGVSAAAIGKGFVSHIAVDDPADATKAMRILRGL